MAAVARTMPESLHMGVISGVSLVSLLRGIWVDSMGAGCLAPVCPLGPKPLPLPLSPKVLSLPEVLARDGAWHGGEKQPCAC